MREGPEVKPNDARFGSVDNGGYHCVLVITSMRGREGESGVREREGRAERERRMRLFI